MTMGEQMSEDVLIDIIQWLAILGLMYRIGKLENK